MQQLVRLLPACHPLARRINQISRETLWHTNISATEPPSGAGVPLFGQLAALSPFTNSSRLWSAGHSPPQDLGPANPVPEEVSETHISNNLTKKLVEAGNSRDLAAVLEVVESAGESFDESAVECALLQVERCTEGMTADEVKGKIHETKTFQMLADMAVSTAGRTAPEVLARTIGVLGRMGFSDEMVFDELARSLMPGVHRLDPQQMHEMIEGLKKVDHSPGVLLLDAINERLAGLGPEVQQQQADQIKQGLKSLGHSGDNTVSPAEPQRQTERIKYTRGGEDRSA